MYISCGKIVPIADLKLLRLAIHPLLQKRKSSKFYRLSFCLREISVHSPHSAYPIVLYFHCFQMVSRKLHKTVPIGLTCPHSHLISFNTLTAPVSICTIVYSNLKLPQYSEFLNQRHYRHAPLM